LPRYNPATSTTSHELPPQGDFGVTYGSGSVVGEYYQDTVSAGAVSIPGSYFGVANTSTIVPFGILGIGPTFPQYIGYSPFIYALASQGTISKAAFALDLRSINDPQGKSLVHTQ
jgi:hypothetical protein